MNQRLWIVTEDFDGVNAGDVMVQHDVNESIVVLSYDGDEPFYTLPRANVERFR